MYSIELQKIFYEYQNKNHKINTKQAQYVPFIIFNFLIWVEMDLAVCKVYAGKPRYSQGEGEKRIYRASNHISSFRTLLSDRLLVK